MSTAVARRRRLAQESVRLQAGRMFERGLSQAVVVRRLGCPGSGSTTGTRRGRPAGWTGCDRTVRQVVRLSLRCGLPHIRLRDMRHSYATAALKAGLHLKIVNARLGHASETFTASVYQHALPGVDREAAGTIAALFVDQVAETPVPESVPIEHENAPSDDP